MVHWCAVILATTRIETFVRELLAAVVASNCLPPQLKLIRDMLDTYDKKSKPVWNHNKAINVTFSMDLYQILEVNEPQQYVLLNAWIIERWYDEFLYWHSEDYDNITEIHLPHSSIWLPDTTLYNSLVMKDDDTRRLLNVKLTADDNLRAAYIELLYPTICSMIFSSWTFDQKGIDYFPHSDTVGMTNYIENEGWHIIRTAGSAVVFRIISPLITSTASGMREEKISLGITTLLSMSILMLMVSDQMPTTSTFIPLIGWFILAMIVIISLGTLASSVVIAIQKRGRLKNRLGPRTVRLVKFIAHTIFEDIPRHLTVINEKELQSAVLQNEICDSPTRGSEEPRKKRRKTPLVLSHQCELSTLSHNSCDASAQKRTQSGQETDISHTSDTTATIMNPPVAFPTIQHNLLEGDNVDLKVNARDTNLVLASSLERSKFDLPQQQISLKKVPGPGDEISNRQNGRMARDEYEWMARVVERLFFITFLIIFASFTAGINSIAQRRNFDAMSLLLFAAVFALSVTSVKIHQTSLEAGKDDEMHYFISARQQLPHTRLVRDLLSTARYDPSVRPIKNHSESLTVSISMSLYQLIDVKWVDEFLDWNPDEYDMINCTVLPYNVFMMMSREESERYMNVVVESKHWEGKRGAQVSFLYPALYTIHCHIDVRYFPYDYQNCSLTLGSWTNNVAFLNYTANEVISMQSYIPNEEWDVISFSLHRREYKYACCQEQWVIIEGFLIIKRKPLYYVVNFITPTTIITLVAIVGFFTPASTSDERGEKITMGITTLLAMSILMLMVSDQIPTTSDFVPLIAWFYLSNIIVISVATFCTSTILCIHSRHKRGKLPSPFVRTLFFTYLCNYFCLSPPDELIILWSGDKNNALQKLKQKRKSVPLTEQALEKEKEAFPNKCKIQSAFTERSMIPKVIESVQGNSENDTGKNTQWAASKLSAKENWARVSFRLHDISSKSRSEVVWKKSSLTPLKQQIRKLSTIHSDQKHTSLWNAAVEFIRFTSVELPQKSESAELKSMKHHRQCTLEWEFLAVIVDRIFLLFFSTVTIIIITALTVTARLAQHHFDAATEMLKS
uniref:Uncharacterized protein n=1 Tax=Setaria digitata TaxID=48799 RepID=A0A915PIS8_9BILA